MNLQMLFEQILKSSGGKLLPKANPGSDPRLIGRHTHRQGSVAETQREHVIPPTNSQKAMGNKQALRDQQRMMKHVIPRTIEQWREENQQYSACKLAARTRKRGAR